MVCCMMKSLQSGSGSLQTLLQTSSGRGLAIVNKLQLKAEFHFYGPVVADKSRAPHVVFENGSCAKRGSEEP